MPYMRAILLCSVLIITSSIGSAMAGGLAVSGGASLSYATGGDSGQKSDVNGHIEGDLANVYLGASIDAYNDSASDEVDLSAGYRNTIGAGLGYDLSYTRNFFPNDGGDCCGDVALSLSLPVNDKLTATVESNYYPEDKTTDAHLTVDFALSDKITLTGKGGRVGNIGAGDTGEWEVAASYALGQETAVTLHYYDSSAEKGYLGLDLTWDTAALGG
jgi:outer membrane usher protein FimD/PapC